jgi:hypothetical protein
MERSNQKKHHSTPLPGQAAATAETSSVQVPNVVLVVLQQRWRLPAVRAAADHAVPDGHLQ